MFIKQIGFVASGKAELLSRELDEHPAPGMVLVRTAVSTLSSGTERDALLGVNGNARVAPPPGAKVGPKPIGTPFGSPAFSGYSSAGWVEAVGEGVTSVKPGDRVQVDSGVHASFQMRPEQNVLAISDGITFAEAALAHISNFSLEGVRKLRPEIGEAALVMGLGILGMNAVQYLRLAGCCPIIAVDFKPERREMAKAFGADYALDPGAPDFTEQVKALTNGGANVCVEVTGAGAALNQALDCMARFGRVSLLGCTRISDFTVDFYRKVHYPGITLVGAHTGARPKHESHEGYWTDRDNLNAIFRLIESGRLHIADMISETHSPADCASVYTRLHSDPNYPLCIQFDWQKL